MRLSEWRGVAPSKDSMTARVFGVLEPALAVLGAAPDAPCWVVWGDDPAVRYTVLVPTPAGLGIVNVRVNVPQEGPRASGKLVRWSRVQLGELSVEIAGGHRVVGAQVEGQVLRGADEQADAIGEFLTVLFAGADGRLLPPV